jgi:hypothetical protein
MKMHHHYADDGRVMTPPSELQLLLKDAFRAFSKLLGHIRLFYMADEIWDGQVVITFNAHGEHLDEIKSLMKTQDDFWMKERSQP